MNLTRIEALAKADRYDEALTACKELLEGGDADVVDVLRIRAYVFARSGNYAKASEDLEVILRTGNATIRDYYQAGDHALKAGFVELSSRHFREVLERGEVQKESWFRSTALFYLAFLEMTRRNYEDALKYVEAAILDEPDCAMPLPGEGMVSIQQLEERIHRLRA